MKHPLKALIAGLFFAATIVAQETGTTPATPGDDIWTAARKGDLTALQQHIDAGVDIDGRDEEHQSTPLHHAAYYGQVETVKWLVEKGAGKNARNNDGITQLDAAYARIEFDEFDSDARKAKREVGEYLDSIGAEKKKSLGMIFCAALVVRRCSFSASFTLRSPSPSRRRFRHPQSRSW